MELLDIMLYSGCVAFLLLGVPKSILAKLGRLCIQSIGCRPLSPNWLTFYSALLTLVGMKVHLDFSPVWGFVIVVGASILDRLDGKMAFALKRILSPPDKWTVGPNGELLATVTTLTIQELNGGSKELQKGLIPFLIGLLRWVIRLFRKKKLIITRSDSTERIAPCACGPHRWWAEFNFPGGTNLGEVFDPFSDKVKSLTIVAIFGHLGLLSPWLVGALFIPELFGTIVRRPFHLLERFIQTSKATGVGKYKVMIQWLLVILCAPYHQHWIESDHWAFGLEWSLNWLLGLVILLALVSVLSRLKWARSQREVKGVLDSLEESTKHE